MNLKHVKPTSQGASSVDEAIPGDATPLEGVSVPTGLRSAQAAETGAVIGRPDLQVGQTVRFLHGRTSSIYEDVITGFQAKGREEAQILLAQDRFCYPTALVPIDDAVLMPGLKVKSLHVTYEIMTKESASEGDFAEIGSEDLTVFRPDEDAVEEVIDTLRRHGPYEPSSCPWQAGSWYNGPVGLEGSGFGEKRFAYHLRGFTDEEEKQIHDALKARGLVY
jgi:hypothetical protein